MVKLIVGLGNPGQQYEKNRHNAGFLFLDNLLSTYVGNWMNESKFQGITGSCNIGGNKVILLKPQTFMNRSGLSVGALVRYYKYKTEDVLVVHDELDIPSGEVKLKMGGGHAGHNGLRDIIASLGEKNFYRIRLGIGRPASGLSVLDYVLSNFSKEDRSKLEAVFELLETQMDNIISERESLAMNEINKI
jgi:PTH1 family peptidyl-tRNA hydrolase